jgi:hypothetical protein
MRPVELTQCATFQCIEQDFLFLDALVNGIRIGSSFRPDALDHLAHRLIPRSRDSIECCNGVLRSRLRFFIV